MGLPQLRDLTVTPKLANAIAKLANAIVCPYYCVRTHGAYFDIRFVPAIALDLTGEDYLRRGVETLDAATTPIIVAHLDQWLMLGNFRPPDGARVKSSTGIPAQAGMQPIRAAARNRLISPPTRLQVWIPAFAGMTNEN